MNTGLPNFAFGYTQMSARRRVESMIDLPRLYAAIDADPDISGAGVVFIDADFNAVVLREFRPVCSIKPKRIILRETPRYTSPQQYVSTIKSHPRESRVVAEASGMALSCVGAVIGWMVVISGSALTPFTAGGSAVVTVLAYGAATASTLQCVAGVVRTTAEVQDPSFNDRLDSEAWYTTTMSILDGVSLLGVGASAVTTVRLLRLKHAAGGKSTKELLRTLSRQERRKLTDELLKMQNPRLTAELIRLRQLAGDLPKRLSNTEIRQGTINQIRDSLGAFLSFAGSALSGNANSIAIGLYEELED